MSEKQPDTYPDSERADREADSPAYPVTTVENPTANISTTELDFVRRVTADPRSRGRIPGGSAVAAVIAASKAIGTIE